MAVNPKSGKVYVSNTDAHNDVRFEGHTPGFTSVVGNTVDSRITVIDPDGGHVTADQPQLAPEPRRRHRQPGAQPRLPGGPHVLGDGKSLYVVAQGRASSPSTTPPRSRRARPRRARPTRSCSAAAARPASPSTSAHGLAFVLTRFDDGISVVDLGARKETAHVAMFNPEPASVTAGRQFLYNATLTSALGDQACASCHIGGDFDGLAWDLGNPGTSRSRSRRLAASESVIHTIPEADIAALIGPQEAATSSLLPAVSRGR
jgi:DNA-binding beta-propeller fold protein YncE